MTFASQPWSQRVATLGDTAESVFEHVAPLGAYERYGFNRPPFKLTMVPEFIRHTPDYVTGAGILVEVMGCGRDGVVKFKVDKYAALRQWAKHAEVAMFLWNSATSEWALVRWEEMVRLCSASKRKHGVLSFDDGNEYLAIEWGKLSMVYPYVV